MTSVECEKCYKRLEGRTVMDLAKVILKHKENGECTKKCKSDNETIACTMGDIV